MSIHHRSFSTSRSWRQWWLTFYKPSNIKRKTGYTEERKDEGTNADCTSESFNEGFTSALKNISITMRSSKTISNLTWKRHKGMSHADWKWHSSVWGSLLHLCLVPRVQATTLFISSSVMQTTSSAAYEAVSNMRKRSDFSVNVFIYET